MLSTGPTPSSFICSKLKLLEMSGQKAVTLFVCLFLPNAEMFPLVGDIVSSSAGGQLATLSTKGLKGRNVGGGLLTWIYSKAVLLATKIGLKH